MLFIARRKFERVAVGAFVIEVLETENKRTKIEIAGAAKHRILRGELKLNPDETMVRTDVPDPEKITKLNLWRGKGQTIKIGADMVIMIGRTGKRPTIGIQAPPEWRVTRLGVSEERLATEVVRERQKTTNRETWRRRQPAQQPYRLGRIIRDGQDVTAGPALAQKVA